MAGFVRVVDRLGVLILVAWLACSLLNTAGAWQADMAGIYMAAQYFATGEWALIYPSAGELITDTPVEWRASLAAMGYEGAPAYPFVYPPIWAAFAAPFAHLLGPALFLSLSAVVQFGLVLWSVRLAWELAGQFMPWPRWAAISTLIIATSAASVSALALNQPQITLVFLILLAASSLARRQEVRAGTLFALAAAIKLTPVLFILVPLALGRRRATLAMFGMLAGLVILDLIVGGIALNRDFIAKASVLGDYTVSARITYNIAPILLSVFGSESDIVRTIAAGGFTALTPLWMKVVSTTALLGLSVLLFVRARRVPPSSQIAVLTTGLALIIALAGPFGWSHYFLLPSLMLPALLGPGQTRLAKAVFVVVLLAASSRTIFLPSLALAQVLPFSAFVLLFWVMAFRPPADLAAHAPLRPASP